MTALILVRFGAGGAASSSTQGLVGAYRQSGQFRSVSGAPQRALAGRALESPPLAMVHAGPLGRSGAHPLSCESLGSLVWVTRLGS